MDQNSHKNILYKEQIDYVFSKVERLLDKKIAADSESHRETMRISLKSARGGYLALSVTLGIGVAGLFTTTYLENRDRDDQVLREANQRKLEIISSISGAITSMRELKDLALISCGKELTKEKREEIKEERIKREFELVKASRPKLHFFSDNFRNLIRNFLSWHDTINDYCDPSAPSEEEWRKKQKEIEDEMVLAPTKLFTGSTYQDHQNKVIKNIDLSN